MGWLGSIGFHSHDGGESWTVIMAVVLARNALAVLVQENLVVSTFFLKGNFDF